MTIDIKKDIPFSFKLFGTTIEVVWDNKRMNHGGMYGASHYSESKIYLSTTHGLDDLSDDKIKDTFYHERVHMILDTMSEYELSKNEKFVDLFAKLLRQSDETLTFKYMSELNTTEPMEGIQPDYLFTRDQLVKFAESVLLKSRFEKIKENYAHEDPESQDCRCRQIYHAEIENFIVAQESIIFKDK